MALVDRVKNILLNPRQEWAVIDTEVTTPVDLYKGYIIPLAAIGPVASFIGSTVFGYHLPFVGTFRTPVGSALSAMIVTYLLTLAGVYVLSLIIDALAPSFGGTKSQIQALKVAAYSSTASWVAGIFSLVPGLRWLGILGLYSLYLLYLGLPVLMKTPAEKAMAYTILVIL
ncbi:MAG TPA: Yip1 family protein, partial [Candidatus Methylomirabilis sp.]|nr:Yip1 family protein [Candidatus Methylomirabilis sp.]